MDLLLLLVIIVATVPVVLFNYYLNYAPGTTPDDYAIGPENASIQCDCCINVFIIGAIAVGALAVSSGYFESRSELYAVALIVFISITLAGFLGRRRRYREWHDAYDLLRSVLPDRAMEIDEDRYSDEDSSYD